MAFYNQGNRPNYQSSIQPLSYKPNPYNTADHEVYIGAAVQDLSQVTDLDFEQPRVLWEKVYDQGAKERFISNVAGHLSAAKSQKIKERTVACFSTVSQELGDKIAKEIGIASQKPLDLLPAEASVQFRANRGTPFK